MFPPKPQPMMPGADPDGDAGRDRRPPPPKGRTAGGKKGPRSMMALHRAIQGGSGKPAK